MDLLRHLRFFSALADTRHFGDAARDLGMTQPPLSQGIRRLEGHLGVRLFDRDARGVRITAPGQHLLPVARELLRSADDLLEQARDMVVPAVLRLGVAADLEGRIPELVTAIARARTPVVPTVASSVELIDQLREGLLDACAVRHPGVIDGLVAGRLHIIPQARSGVCENTAWNQVALPVAAPPRHHQPAAHDQFVDALRRAGHHGGILEAADATQRMALVAAGLAVGVSPTVGEVEASGYPCPPLRVCVTLPSGVQRRPEIDHDAVVDVLEQALAS